MSWPTRRGFLAALGAGSAGALAGCLDGEVGDAGDGAGAQTVEASFFVVSDFTAQVAGETASVDTLVPFGQHGHGWEPGPNVQRKVFDADVFVYVGEGFQPWADRLVGNLRDDDAATHVVEAWADVDLLAPSGHHDDSHAGHEEEAGAHDGDETHHEETDHEETHHETGTQDEADHEETHHEETHHDATGDEHDHGSTDPHFWLDPTRAATAVETLATGLAEADPSNESTVAENAAATTDRLSALDETFRSRLEGRTRDTVLVAGHNAIQYLGDRYEFRVEALTGIAPDAEPTPRDVTRAQEVIAEHDVEYVLAPVFESDRAATQLVEETDAVGTLPITAIPGETEAWREQGWGYVDVMEQVNLPTLERALGAR